MKVLMYGLEFTSHISGGLGTACFALTESLTRSDIQILLVIPNTDIESNGEKLKAISVSKIDVPLCSILKHKIQHVLKSYDTLNKFKAPIKKIGKASPVNTWLYLQTSDHFYSMSSKTGNDGNVHNYFSSYASSYAAFINYMNELLDMSMQIEKQTKDRHENIHSFDFPHMDTLEPLNKNWKPEALTF